MLLSSLADLAAPLAAFLATVAPLASSELRQGPTEIEYVKRFAASPVGATADGRAQLVPPSTVQRLMSLTRRVLKAAATLTSLKA